MISSTARWLGALLAGALIVTACSTTNDEPRADWGPKPQRAGGLSVLASSDRDGFRLHTQSGDRSFLPGVNLGSTTPLHQPGEVGGIDRAHWKRWIREIGDFGFRVVRVYTLLPPSFYEELAAYNEKHASAPLYLVHGIYLPNESYNVDGKTLYTPAVDDAFTKEIADLSAAVHGDLVRKPMPGRAHGTYRTDVSRWLVSWIIGVEWDPVGVVRTNKVETDYRPGRYFAATAQASATEQWIAGHMDALAAAEHKRGVSIPIAFVNWPTTDPVKHPTEPLKSEDLVGVDANHILPTKQWPGGTFASFHAYPYYPDFQRYEKSFEATTWRGKPDRYAGYLMQLKKHFAPHMPLLITEFGVPASLGSAHIGTEDADGLTRDQGGHSEQQAMAMNADMMRMMHDKGIAASFVFVWADEWFKRTWNTMEHQEPERRQLWHDPLTNEQWFGIVATDPDPIEGAAVEQSPDSGAVKYLYVNADASWVHIDITGRDATPEKITIDADVLPGPQKADYRIEVDRRAGTAQLLVRKALDPMRLDTSMARYHPDRDKPWHLYRLMVNRRYPGHPAEYQDVGNLKQGNWDPKADDYDSLATWQVLDKHDTVKLRIPWSMLGLADPSSRTALGEGTPAKLVKIPGINFTVTADGDSVEQHFDWTEWNYTKYEERLKAGTKALKDAVASTALT